MHIFSLFKSRLITCSGAVLCVISYFDSGKKTLSITINCFFSNLYLLLTSAKTGSATAKCKVLLPTVRKLIRNDLSQYVVGKTSKLQNKKYPHPE